MILASECLDHPQDATADTTAALAYDAVDLTPLGEAKEAERDGEKVIRHTNIPNVWLAILDSEISAEELGHWTHKGTRRMWVRIWDPGSEAGLVQLRLEWRTLGTTQWSRNPIVSTPLTGDWALIDLGECRPGQAALGDERWECRVVVRTTGTAGADLDIQRLYPLPTEQFAVVRQPITVDTPTDLMVSDAFNQAAGNATGKSAEVGGEYAAAEKSDATDFTISGGKLKRTAVEDSGNFGEVMGPEGVDGFLVGRAIGTPKEVTDIAVRLDFSISTDEPYDLYFGLLLSYVNNGKFVALYLHREDTGDHRWNIWRVENQGGLTSSKRIARMPGIEGDSPSGTLVVVATDGILALYDGSGNKFAVDTCPLAGTKGKVMIFDENRAEAKFPATREYDNLAIWEPDLPVLCSAGRSIEPRTDGVFRQHPTDDVWGELIPEGFLPYASPSGLEGRKSRFIVIPTSGDLGELPDSGDNPLSAQVFTRAAYHVARESAP